MSITTPVLLPVMILDPRERGEREAVIERLHRRARRVDVRLTLDDGTAAEACLDADEAAWLELRDGDIVARSRHCRCARPAQRRSRASSCCARLATRLGRRPVASWSSVTPSSTPRRFARSANQTSRSGSALPG